MFAENDTPCGTSEEHPSDAASIRDVTVSELLKAGLSDPARPVDSLIQRLGRSDAEAWLGQILTESAVAIRNPKATLLDAAGSIGELREVKSRSKKIFRDARNDHERQIGLAGYFFVLAAGIVHHKQLLTGRSRKEVNTILIDLAEVAPAPWAAFLQKAALAEINNS